MDTMVGKMSAWARRTTSSASTIQRLEQGCTLLLPIVSCLLAWGRHDILAVIFFSSFSFLCMKQAIVLFLKNEGFQRRVSSIVCMFAPALSPLVTFTCTRARLREQPAAASCADVHESFCNTSPRIESEIQSMVDYIVQDYILFWFRIVSPDDEEFVNECRTTFTNMFTILVREKLIKVQPDRLIPQALAALRNHVQMSGNKHPDARQARESGIVLMHSVADFLLTSCAPDALNRMRHPANGPINGPRDSILLMVKEMLAFAVLMPIASHLARPELLFRSIIGLFSESGAKKWTPDSSMMPSSVTKAAAADEKKCSLDGAKGVDLLSDPLSNPLQSWPPFDPDPGKSHVDGHVTEYAGLPSASTRVSLDAVTGLEKGLEVGDEAEQRLFTNIRLSDTRINGLRGDYFVEYRITYDGLFEMLEEVASSRTAVSCLVRQEVSVWRRFSEFVSLHQQLEACACLRPFLKRIENPIRLKTVTSIFGSKLARSTTIQRRMFLLRYMNKLADIPVIANSLPLRVFLAYDMGPGSKATKSTASKASVFRSLVPRGLDKVISEGIKGAVSVIKNVIPVDTYQDGYFTFFSSTSVRAKIDTVFGHDLQLCSSLDPQVLEQWIQDSKESMLRQESNLSADSAHDLLCDNHPEERPNKHNCHHGKNVIPGRKSVEILVELFELIRSEGRTANDSIFLYIVKSLFGDFLETILQQVVSLHLNEESFALLIHSLHKSIWSPSVDQNPKHEATAEAATQVLVNWIKSKPLVYRFLPFEADKLIAFAINSLRDQERNQLLINELIYVFLVHLRDEC